MKLTLRCSEIGLKPGERMARFAERLPELHERLGQAWLLMVQRNFEGEHEPDGRPWRPLSQLTAGRRLGGRKRGRHPILRVSGRLSSSLQVRADAERAVIGTNLVYAPIHQFGGVAGRGVRIPARPWLFGRDGGVPENFRAHLLNIARKELEECLS